MRHRLVLAGAFTACALVAARAQQAAPPPQPPTFRGTTTLVQVDAIVTDASDVPIANLTADDFTVADDGVQMPISAFRFVSATAGANWHDETIAPIRNVDDEAREASREGVRLFAIFLDEYHVARFGELRVVPALVDFVRSLPPADLVAVYYPVDSVMDVRFTRDRAAAIARIQAFEGRQSIYMPPKYPMEEEHLRHPRDIERLRMQVSTSALDGLLIHLGGLVEGRKSVILVSESVGPRGPERGGSQLAQVGADAEYLTDTVNTANRGNVSIYPLDPRGLTVGGVGNGAHAQIIDLFKTLADQTGGRAIVNTNDFRAPLARAASDASAYYLLGYVSAHPGDGKFHKIHVTVKRRGVTVRARAGYLASKADETTAPAIAVTVPREVQTALDSLAEAMRPDAGESIRGDRFRTAGPDPPVGLPDVPTIAVVQGRETGEPVTRREFARTERLLIQMSVSEHATMTARLLSRLGQPLADLPVTLAAGRARVPLTLGTLGPGDYVVELTLHAGEQSARRFVAFRVAAR